MHKSHCNKAEITNKGRKTLFFNREYSYGYLVYTFFIQKHQTQLHTGHKINYFFLKKTFLCVMVLYMLIYTCSSFPTSSPSMFLFEKYVNQNVTPVCSVDELSQLYFFFKSIFFQAKRM